MWLTIQRIKTMMNQVKSEPESATAAAVNAAGYSSSNLRLEMPVMDLKGKAIGRVAALHHDALSGRLTGLTVRHGMLGRKYTLVSVDAMDSISQGMITLTQSKAAFGELPLTDAPPVKNSKAAQTWPR
jgi:uncharacterized protein YrrD